MGQQSLGEQWRAQPFPWDHGGPGGARKSLPSCFRAHLGLESVFGRVKGGNERQRHKNTVSPSPSAGIARVQCCILIPDPWYPSRMRSP